MQRGANGRECSERRCDAKLRIMKAILHTLSAHPYLALFVAGLSERIGIPLLLSPVLIAAGALAATGDVRFDAAVWVALVACVIGDGVWFEMGRLRGDSILSTLCRISLEPQGCVRRSKGLFEKGSMRTLLLSKWLPGVSHVVPAVAGLVRIERERFLFANTLGSFLWIVVLMALGYVPVKETHTAGAVIAITPAVLEMLVVFAAGNVGFKYLRKRRFLQQLDKARIEPEELRDMIQNGQEVVIVDLRHALDSVTDPRVIPGAIRMLPEEVTAHADRLPKGRDIVLYCT
jgi:membrane protein DedA with SNARE-associated domain